MGVMAIVARDVRVLHERSEGPLRLAVAIDARLLPVGKDPVIKRSRPVGRKPSQFHCLTRSARTVCRNYRRLAYTPASNFDSSGPACRRSVVRGCAATAPR